MKNLGRKTMSRGLVLILVLALMANIPTAWAATGDVLRQFVPTGPTGNGRGMAFDGTNLYYTIVSDTNIYKTDMFGTLVATIPTPIANGVQPAGGPLAWDGTNLWTINYGTNGDMVQLTPGGALVSTCNIFTNNPGHPALTPSSKIDSEDGLDWTGIPGSELVLSGEVFTGNSVIFMNTSCGIQSWFTAPITGGFGTSGVAFDGINLWHSNGHFNQFQTDVTGVQTGLSFTNSIQLEDLAYDAVTFAPKCALWSDEATTANNHITAYEVPCGKPPAPKGSIAGMKFNDLNGNGVNDAEPGLANWIITLTNETGSIVTQTTASDGSYNFTNLTDGNYTVGEVLQNNWIQTAPAVSTTGSATYTVQISGGNDVTGKDFGNFQFGSVSGTKFEDLNSNGIRDAGEVGLAGWNITINGTDSITGTTVNQTTTTDANGNYNFTGLTAGTYTITETMQSGWVQTAPSTGFYTVTITSEAVITGQDFGNFHKGKITGGGWINITGDPKATFGFVGQYPDASNTANGSVEYQDHIANLNIKSIQINTVATTLDKKKGAITGLAQVNGAGSYPFVVYVEDNAEPGKGADVFMISLPTYPYSNGAILSGGNIQIHS
jgi:hypothetical protein